LMPVSGSWIIRVLAVRLRQPGMRSQRRFMVAVSLLTALLVIVAVIYLFRQPTEEAMERAALKVLLVAGIFITVVVAAAVVVRKRTGASWPQEEALQMADETAARRKQPMNRS
jgi:hypothetical protein